MSWSLFNLVISEEISVQLKRIADALERIAPEPGEPVDLTPEDAVSYVDEEKMAKLEIAEEMGELERIAKAMEEEAEKDKGDRVMQSDYDGSD